MQKDIISQPHSKQFNEDVMSYGEAHTHLKNSIEMIQGEWVSSSIPKHRPKMKRSEAMRYYSDKLNNYFKTRAEI